MPLLKQLVKHALTSVLPRRWLLTTGPVDSAGVALTFDDGPDPVHTPRILDLLAAANARATFFVIGERAARYPELLQRIVHEGHALGNHTYTHREPALVSAPALAREVERTRRVIEDLAGVRVPWFRPPRGGLSTAKCLALWRLGQTVVLWNRDPRDYRPEAPADLPSWTDAYVPQAGDIVLLHDNHPHCLPLLPELIRKIRCERELHCQTLAEWHVGQMQSLGGWPGPGPAEGAYPAGLPELRPSPLAYSPDRSHRAPSLGAGYLPTKVTT